MFTSIVKSVMKSLQEPVVGLAGIEKEWPGTGLAEYFKFFNIFLHILSANICICCIFEIYLHILVYISQIWAYIVYLQKYAQ